MKTTGNYALKKPEGTDVVNVDDFNGNADIIDSKLKELETNTTYYAVATGSANTYAISVSAIKSYFDGLSICVKINVASTGASTININGYGAKTILDSLGNAITSGGLKAGLPYSLRYNGTNFILLSKGGGGNVTADKLLLGATATGDSGQVTGTMPNNGALSTTLAINGSFTIPSGYTSGGTVTQSIPTKATATITPGTTAQTITSGQYILGTQTIAGDSNLVTGNIKAGSTIFGVPGKSSVVDTADATATADKILTGSNGYVNGAKVTGTMANNGAVTSILGINGSYTIPKGFHDGTGKVTQSIPIGGASTITPGTANKTISAGQYLSGVQTILGDPELIASNILSGVNIFGVTGTLSAPSIGARKFASGTVTPSSTSATFNFYSSGSKLMYPVTITGLDFTPQFIYMCNDASNITIYNTMVGMVSPGIYTYKGATTSQTTSGTQVSNYAISSPANVVTGSFTLPAETYLYAYRWLAVGY